MKTNEAMKSYVGECVGPVMVEYTKWIISQCQQRKIKKIYFLARDGYLLCEIAKKICKRNNLQIECRYLYCSRYSLRLSSFHLLEEEQAYKLCFQKCYHTSAQVLLKNAGLTDAEMREVLGEISFSQPQKNLSAKEYDKVVRDLKNNAHFKEIMLRNSKKAYENAIEYFKQEKIFEGKEFVIADSGWTGSMQKSFRQLLNFAGFEGKIIGFYFGLVNKTCSENGEYLSFYFSHKRGMKRKIMFNNNLFECMLSANHGTTLGYEKVSGKMVPILKEMAGQAETKQIIAMQIEEVLSYLHKEGTNLDIRQYNQKLSVKGCFKGLKKAMVFPSKSQIELLSKFHFSDATTESYTISLCDKTLKKQLKKQLLVCLFFKKIFHLKGQKEPALYWTYGVIRRCPKILQPLYRLDFYIHEFLRFCLTK